MEKLIEFNEMEWEGIFIILTECFLVRDDSLEWDLILVRGSVSYSVEACFHGQIIQITLSPQDTAGLKVWMMETNMGFIHCLCGGL